MLRDERYVKNKYEVVDVGCFNEKKIGRRIDEGEKFTFLCNLVDVFNNFHERSWCRAPAARPWL